MRKKSAPWTYPLYRGLISVYYTGGPLNVRADNGGIMVHCSLCSHLFKNDGLLRACDSNRGGLSYS